MLIVYLAGVGASVTAGSAAAHSLVSTTFCVQLLVFLWITCLCPSVDRVDNVAVALGWGLSIELHMGMTYVMDHVVYRLPILHKKMTHSSAPRHHGSACNAWAARYPLQQCHATVSAV